MSKTIIPFFCPHCGADIWQLDNDIRESVRGNVVLVQRCKICESSFDIGSLTENGLRLIGQHTISCIDTALQYDIEDALDNFGRLVRVDEPTKAEV